MGVGRFMVKDVFLLINNLPLFFFLYLFLYHHQIDPMALHIVIITTTTTTTHFHMNFMEIHGRHLSNSLAPVIHSVHFLIIQITSLTIIICLIQWVALMMISLDRLLDWAEHQMDWEEHLGELLQKK